MMYNEESSLACMEMEINELGPQLIYFHFHACKRRFLIIHHNRCPSIPLKLAHWVGNINRFLLDLGWSIQEALTHCS